MNHHGGCHGTETYTDFDVATAWKMVDVRGDLSSYDLPEGDTATASAGHHRKLKNQTARLFSADNSHGALQLLVEHLPKRLKIQLESNIFDLFNLSTPVETVWVTRLCPLKHRFQT